MLNRIRWMEKQRLRNCKRNRKTTHRNMPQNEKTKKRDAKRNVKRQKMITETKNDSGMEKDPNRKTNQFHNEKQSPK